MVSSNYRPISLISIFAKIFEKMMRKRLVAYILDEKQFGFQENEGVEDALLTFTHSIYDALDKHNKIICTLLDISKALDSIAKNAYYTRWRG